jgi:hypothetical protein
MEEGMRIQIPVAAYVNYNPATYVEKALRDLGHNASITQGQVSEEDDPSVDLYLCVDSGGPLVVHDSWAHKSAFWFIDSRRNCNPEVRTPDDDAQAEKIFKAGGHVFQAQYEDTLRLKEKGVNSHWLPLAADPDVWSNHPKEEKLYDVAFVGNCFDPVRHEILGKLEEGFNFCWPGIEKAIMEDGAKVYRQSRVGFNISSFYGQGVDYDINMRVFEIMSCGVPLVTNYVLGLDLLPGLGNCPGIFCYQSLDGIATSIEEALACETVYTRNSILENHTYRHRAQKILEIVGA